MEVLTSFSLFADAGFGWEAGGLWRDGALGSGRRRREVKRDR
ncbi:hypothetical protein THTE_0479 [Thermogutta terrifontis]|uniref:Uncharacterized protein n=1 Tax=Thermogutta terrifontis TaxID=1331910 RepID=A0A286RAV8_9BACT|nr:hypothetical protein THTE_0479 [Thermogutta terrifontis]